MNLESMPQPVRMSEKCSLDQLPNIQLSGGSDVKLVSLFEQKRLKGFWPVYSDAGGVRQLTVDFGIVPECCCVEAAIT